MEKRKSFNLLMVAALASSVLFSSCIGSFSLSNKLLDWNRNIDSKFINELVFIAFWIVPVYEIAIAADVLILNTIEFWGEENPVADAGKVETVKTDDGVYTVETKTDGYRIQKEGEEKAIDLVFDSSDKSWSVEAEGESTKILRFESDDEVVMFLPGGEEMNVELSRAGVLAFKQVVENQTHYAAR
ncbi:MAG: DUF3332 domain-containing protein [Tannerellaceae bacterium]|jgi:hypothetical protein|nr:DUF3332 domain-containing protein [Tannerellaceae bacterium]